MNAITRRANRRRGERGSVLAYTTVSMLFLFFAAGLGVDISHLYLVKSELQNAADAAALAGASALTLPDAEKITEAVNRAVGVMNENKYNFNNKRFVEDGDLSVLRPQVEFAVNLDGPYVSEATAESNPTNYRFVRVITPAAPVNVYFAAPLLGSQRNLTATAVSGLSVPGNVNFCPAPLSAIQCPNDPSDPDYATCQLEFAGECPTPGIQADGCDPNKNFCKGCTYTIRAEPAGGPAPGNYQILDCAGSGASAVRQALAGTVNCGACGQISPGDEVEIPTQPGVEAGPVRQGLNTRFDVYSGGGVNATDHPPDPNIYEGVRTGNGNNQTATGLPWADYKAATPGSANHQAPSNLSQPNRRILILPIIDIGEYTDGNGRQVVRVGSLGGFFMQKKVGGGNDGHIKAEYIGDEVIDAIGFDPNDINTTNVVTAVLYR